MVLPSKIFYITLSEWKPSWDRILEDFEIRLIDETYPSDPIGNEFFRFKNLKW